MEAKYLWLIAIILMVGCTEQIPPESSLTILVYMAADNSLSEFAMLDIAQMELAEFSAEDVQIIVQADFLYTEEEPGCRRWLITADSIYNEEIHSLQIENLGEIDSGDWRSLAEFYNWGVEAYPALHYVLGIWSHGNDWYSYPATPNHFCPDQESSSWFDIPGKDLRNAFQQFKVKPELVMLDACHMQSLEVLSEMSDLAQRFCGSADVIPNQGFPYQEIFSYLTADLPLALNYADLPQIYVQSYRPCGSQNLQGLLNQPVSGSLIESSVLQDSVTILLAELVEKVLLLNPPRQSFWSARANCYEFNDLKINVDFFEFISFLSEENLPLEIKRLAERLAEQAMLSHDYYNYPAYDLGKLSITFPEQADLEHWVNLAQEYSLLEFHLRTGWGDFLSWLLGVEAYCS